MDVGALESEVYDHLFSFFRRYYSEGDFLAKRVYKPGVYAIPYEGEEVTLHWANKDQYYIKTSEYLRDYAFRLRPDDDKKPMRVHFRLADAAEGEHGNVKAAEGKDRVFILSTERHFGPRLHCRGGWRAGQGTRYPLRVPPGDADRLARGGTRRQDQAACAEGPERARRQAHSGGDRRFTRPVDRGAGQAARHARAARRPTTRGWRRTCAATPPATPSTTSFTRTLGAFLRRELDFYIKNEVMHLDDVENEIGAACRAVPLQDQGHPQDRRQDHRLPRPARGLPEEAVAEEEVRGRDAVLHHARSHPEEFYAEIAANEAQREEWVTTLCDRRDHGRPDDAEFLHASYRESYGQTKILSSTRLVLCRFQNAVLNCSRTRFEPWWSRWSRLKQPRPVGSLGVGCLAASAFFYHNPLTTPAAMGSHTRTAISIRPGSR